MLKHRGLSGKFDVTKQCSQLQKALQSAVERSKSNYALDEEVTGCNDQQKIRKLSRSHSHALNSGIKITPKRGFLNQKLRSYNNQAFLSSTHTISENEIACFECIDSNEGLVTSCTSFASQHTSELNTASTYCSSTTIHYCHRF